VRLGSISARVARLLRSRSQWQGGARRLIEEGLAHQQATDVPRSATWARGLRWNHVDQKTQWEPLRSSGDVWKILARSGRRAAD